MIRLLATVLLMACAGQIAAAEPAGPDEDDEQPLSFAFLDDPPGRMVSIGTSRLHLDCRGEGEPTVLFEVGLGGSALEWSPVRERIGPRVRTCTYDRAGYGWSDPVIRSRDAARLARELDTLIERAGIDGPLVLVAHSFGGFIARLLRDRRPADVVGLVLIDSSHEEQFVRLASEGGTRMLPRGRQFVINSAPVPANLPRGVRRRIEAFSRMRKTYTATHGEMGAFAESAEQVRMSRARHAAPFDSPLAVVRRGLRLYGDASSGQRKDALWAELQNELAALSTRSRVLVAPTSGHHVHADDPDRVVEAIRWVLEQVNDG